MAQAEKAQGSVPVAALSDYVAAIFEKLGVAVESAGITARALVAADLEGVPSHGVMLVPMYVDRMLAGSVSTASAARLAQDSGPIVVLDARHALGQVTSHQAVSLARERAREHGMASVAVRNGFHFGTAGYWARAIAGRGFIAIVMSNTRPLMPASGGAQRLVGNNPLAIAVPNAGGPPLLLDMATSATSMGRIRLADAAGQPIPEGWALDDQGRSTTDAAAAIKGMLLPAAGPKGFGLAVMIDLLCGGLSGGAIADEVQMLYGDPSVPYGCAHLFLALDTERFGVGKDFPGRTAKLAQKIRASRRASGVERIYAPGDIERERAAASGERCPVSADTLSKLVASGRRIGVHWT